MKTIVLALFFCVCVFILWETIRITRNGKRAVDAGKKHVPVSWTSNDERGKILIIGDSTSRGVGVSHPKYALTGLLARDFPQYRIINLSQNALKISQVTPLLSTTPPHEFDYLFVHIGGMDTIHFTSSNIIRKELQNLFATATAHGIKKIFLISMNNVGSAPFFRFPLSQIYTFRSRQLTHLFADICKQYPEIAIHVPLFTERQNEPLRKDGQRHFSEDNIHPNDKGYALWHQQIKQIATHFLAPTSQTPTP